MKRLKIVMAVFLSLVLAGIMACAPGTTNTEAQTAKVVRGDLTLSVSGSGKIKAPREMRLTFNGAGKVDEILAKEGDSVDKGDVIARMETNAPELAKSQAEVSLGQAKLGVTQAEITLKNAQHSLQRIAENSKTLELAVLGAEISLEQAKYNLDVARELYTWPDLDIAQSDVDDARARVQYALNGLSEAATPAEITMWTNFLVRAQAELDAAEARLNAIKQGFDPEEVQIKEMQVRYAEESLAKAEKDVHNIDDDIVMQEQQVLAAQASLEQAKHSVALAEKSLKEAVRNIEEAVLKAPFSGVIASIDVEEGQFVTSASSICRLIDNTSLELFIEVDEIDIPLVKEGQKATVSFDALAQQRFSATIALVYPAPREVGGIVLYDVKLVMDAPPDSGLRIGMSASANLVIDERESVLMVPSRAVKQDEQGAAYVEVVLNGEIARRPVATGLSDGFLTEITGGLNAGEDVVISVRTGQPEGGGFFFGQ